jgi:hypothetical protein
MDGDMLGLRVLAGMATIASGPTYWLIVFLFFLLLLLVISEDTVQYYEVTSSLS